MDSGLSDNSCDCCFEESREPRRGAQDCSHVFCYSCLHKEPVYGAVCPACTPGREMGQGLDGLPSTRNANRVTEVAREHGARSKETTAATSPEQKPTTEKAPALLCCFLCKQNKQHVCLSAGNLLKLLKNGHRINTPNNTPKPENPDMGKRYGFCEKHDCEELKFYCETCLRRICRDCALLEHRTHTYVYYKDRKAASPRPEETLQRMYAQVEEKKKALEGKIAILDANLEKKIKEIESEKERVLSTNRQLRKLISDQESALIAYLEENKSLMSRCVDTKKAVLRTALGEVNQGLELARGAVKREETNKQIYSAMSHQGPNKCMSKSVVGCEETVAMETDLPSHLNATSASVSPPFGNNVEESDEEPSFTANSQGSSEVGNHLRNSDLDSDEYESEADSGTNSDSEFPVEFEGAAPDHTLVVPVFTYVSSIGSKGTEHASFQDPVGIATSSEGTLAIADYTNDRVQLFTSGGELIRVITHVITEKGRKVALLSPTGVAFDKAGNLVITERGRHRITVTDQTGKLVCKFGKLGKAFGQLRSPHGVSVDRIGRIIVADTANNRIQVFEKDGEFVFAFGSKGEHKLDYPNYAIYHNGVFYVSDTDNDSVKVFKKDGTFLRSLCINNDPQAGPLCPVKDLVDPVGPSEDQDVPFSAPSGLAIYRDQCVLVCDYNRDTIKVFSIPQGLYLTEFGQEGIDPGQFCGPEAVAVLPDGRVVVSDKGNHRLQMFTSNCN